MTSHKTSAKGPADPPKRMQVQCPACGKQFSLNHSEYRKYEKRGMRPACSRVCGAKMKVAAACRKYCEEPFPNGAVILFDQMGEMV
jgi:hypothetical protein